MNHDIRAAVGPVLDAAIDAVAHPGDRIAWDLTTSLILAGPGQYAVQCVVAISTPSPIVGESITSMRQVDLWNLANGTTALDLVRELVENVRSMRAKLIGLEPGHPPITGLDARIP